MAGGDGRLQQVIAHAVTAAWRWALASIATRTYTAAFAPDFDSNVHGEAASSHAVAEFLALAGWTPTLTAAQEQRLREAATGEASRADFVAALHDEVDLGTAWGSGFLDTAFSTPALCTPAGDVHHRQEAS